MDICVFVMESYLLMDVFTVNDYALQKQNTSLLWTWQAVVPCEVTVDNNFSMGTLGQLDGPKHSDFLSFLNYVKP